MKQVHRLIRRARLRLWVIRLSRAIGVGAACGAGVVVLWRIGDLLVTLPTDWNLLWVIALAGGGLAGITWAWWTRPRTMSIARLVDERAGLRESLSTAIWASRKDDEWSAAARTHADSVAHRVVLRDAIPIRVPRAWAVAPILGLLFYGLTFVPNADLLRTLEKEQIAKEQEAELIQANVEVKSSAEEIQNALAGIDEGSSLLEDLDLETPDPEAKTPDEIRKAHIRTLTTLADRINQLEQQGKGQTIKTMQDQLRQLRQPREAGMEHLDKMVRALQSGDFKEAISALDELQKKVNDSATTAEKREQMAKQIEELAKQLEELSRQQMEAMQEALRQAGIDPKLASDPNAMQQAIQNNPNLTAQQKQALQNMAKAAQGACQQCNNMGKGMQNLADALRQGGNCAGAIGQMAGQLSDLEMMQGELNKLRAAHGQIVGQMQKLGGQCQGGGSGLPTFQKWSLGSIAQGGKKKGPGGAGAGGSGAGTSGSGSNAINQADPNDFTTDAQRTSTLVANDGPPIGSRMLEGEQIRGEARQQFSEVVQVSSKNASEAIETLVVPREYHDAVKAYFGRLEQHANSGGSNNSSQDKDAEQ